MRCFQVTNSAMENQEALHISSVCSFRHHACNGHAPYYIAICGPSGCTTFFNIVSKMIYGKKILSTKRVFWFCLQNLSDTFLVLRILRDIIKKINTWCGRKAMRLATLYMNRRGCCLPLHMAVRLTTAVYSVQVWTC